MVALLPALALVSCDKDDDNGGNENPNPALATSIEGEYPVTIYYTLDGSTPDPETATQSSGTVTITATADNTATISLKEFSVEPMGEIPMKITGITTTGSINNVNVAYEGSIETSSPAISAMGDLSGVLSGTVADGKLNFTLPVTVALKGGDEMHINVLIQSQPALAATVAGEYPVNIYYKFAPQIPDPDTDTPSEGKVTITKTGDNTVTLALSGFSVEMMGEIPMTIDGITTTGTESNVSVTYDGPIKSDSPIISGMGELSTILSGTVANGKLDFTLPVTLTTTAGGSMGININVLVQSQEDQE